MDLSKDYIEKHLEPSRNWWKVEPISPDGTQEIQTHNGYKFTVSVGGDIDWRVQIPAQEKTSRMWLLSLGFLVRIWEDNPGASMDILSSFHRFIEQPSNAEFVYSIASSDHCAAARLRTMCFIIASGRTDDKVAQLALDIARRDCDWILSTPNAMPMNNHGMMVATALLHVCAVMNLDISNDLSAKAKSFFLEMFTSVFDKNGLCNENTIGYHDFYLKTLTQLRNFAKDFGITDIAEIIDQFLPKIESALHKAVWNSGGIPPIGDSGEYPTRHKSTLGLHAFDTGMTVYKDEKTYLSVICGCLTETHKHMDDTSITLRHKDTDLIIDCGSYNYDWSDPFRQCLSSTRGHSCLAIEEFDHLPRGNFYRENGKTYSASSRIIGTNPPSIQCEIEIKEKGISARRDVTFASPGHIIIRDTLPHAHKAVQRFIVPGAASITVIGADVFVQNGEISMLITANSNYITVVKGQKDPVYKGWASKKFGEIEPAYCLEVQPNGKSILQTHIYFGDGSGGKPKSLPITEKYKLAVRKFFRPGLSRMR